LKLGTRQGLATGEIRQEADQLLRVPIKFISVVGNSDAVTKQVK
jgi:hypothetical protein